MRPPARGSKVTVRPGSAETEWLVGHHSDVRSAHTENACSGGHATVNASSSGGSVISGPRGDSSGCFRRDVFGGDREARGGLAPHALEIGAHRLDALVVQPVEPAGPLRAVDHQ